MSYLLKELMSDLGFANLGKMNIDMLKNLTFHFYGKDKKGKYLFANDLQAKNVGFTQGTELIGCNDFDISKPNSVRDILKNDEEVIATKQSKLIIESSTPLASTCGRVLTLSYKKVLLTRARKLIGVVGFSFLLDPSQDGQIFNILNVTSHNKNNQINTLTSSNPYHLSRRQLQCLFYLIRGKTNKQIGELLRLSPRTIESYINQIKLKMRCFTRGQIIEKTINERFI